MITKIIFELEIKKRLNYNMGKSFQGVLMEYVSEEYGDILHKNSFKPYSQFVYYDEKNKKNYWEINTLNKEAREEIINKLCNEREFYLKAYKLNIKVASVHLEETSYKEIIEEVYNSKNTRYINFNFKSPVSFKSRGEYINFIEPYMIYNNLSKKWDYFSKNYKLRNNEVFDLITKSTEVWEFNVRSTKFNLSKAKIPSFIGNIKLKINCNVELCRIIKILELFSYYSGVGVKTAMGMGKCTRNHRHR